MYSSAKKVGVPRSQPRTRRSTKLAATRAARSGAARVPARAKAARGAGARSAVRAATDTVSLSAARGGALAATGRDQHHALLAVRLDSLLFLGRLVGDEELAV